MVGNDTDNHRANRQRRGRRDGRRSQTLVRELRAGVLVMESQQISGWKDLCTTCGLEDVQMSDRENTYWSRRPARQGQQAWHYVAIGSKAQMEEKQGRYSFAGMKNET